MNRKKAQSMLEYVLLITVVALVIIYGANNVIKPQAKDQIDTAGNAVATAVSKFSAAVN